MTIVQRQQAAVAALQSLKSSIKLDSFAAYDPGRDGGTGRRSGLKIRRPSGLGGSTPPPGTISRTHKIRSYLGSLSACDEPVQQTQRTLRQYITNERLVYPTENSKFTYKMLD
jgi:hypothetical protein